MHTQEKIIAALGELASLYTDQAVSEIMVDGPNQVRVVEQGKIVEKKGILTSAAELRKTIKNIFNLVGRELDQQACADLRLADGTRVMAIGEAISLSGPVFNLRKLPAKTFDWNDLIKHQAITLEGKDILANIFREGKSVILGGSLASGKTTLASNMVSLIDEQQRVICLEKVPELDIKHPWTVRLQTLENQNSGMSDLLKAASMMRPDYIVLNEIIGDEVPLMLDMMREGYSIFGTMMADSVTDVLRRLEFKYISQELSYSAEQIKELIATSVDYVVFMSKTQKGRRVTEIMAVTDFVEGKYCLKPIYRWDGE